VPEPVDELDDWTVDDVTAAGPDRVGDPRLAAVSAAGEWGPPHAAARRAQ